MGRRDTGIREKSSDELFLVFSGPAQELATNQGVTTALVTLSHTEHHAMACIVLDG
jgi:phosphopantetheinyl transferase (holo-ACP synthase)